MTVTDVPAGPDVGESAMEGGSTTVNVAVADDDPLLALTVLAPTFADAGMAKVALNAPAEVVVIVAGTVVTAVPLKVTEICELGG